MNALLSFSRWDRADLAGLLALVALGLIGHALLQRHWTGRTRIAWALWLPSVVLFAAGAWQADRAGRAAGEHVLGLLRKFPPAFAREMEMLGHARITLETAPDDPLYLALIEAEKRWLQLFPEAHDIYTVRRRPDGKVVIMVDSETDYDHDGTYDGPGEQRVAIGRHLGETTGEFADQFSGREGADLTPSHDAAGSWITFWAPIFGPDRQVEAVLCVDYSVAAYDASIRQARLYVLFGTGAFLVLFYFSGAIIVSLRHNLGAARRAEQALQKSEARFRALVDNSADAILLLDRTGLIRSANPAAARLHGYAPAELPGMNIRELDTPGDAQLAAARLRRLVAGETLTFEVEHRRKDGTTFPLEVAATPMQHGDEVVIISSQRDITGRKHAEQALRQRETESVRFKSVLDQTQDCVFMFRPEDLRFVYANDGARRQVGYTEAELLALTPPDIKPEFTPEKFRRLVQPLLDGTRASHTFETLHRHKDGHDVPVEIVLQFVQPAEGERRFVAIVRDITERKRAQHTVAESMALLRATLESTADGILTVGADGKIQSFNGRFAEMWRIPADIIAARDDNQALQFVLGQLAQPEAFIEKVRHLYAHPAEASFDTLEFKDGRTFERYSRPMFVEGRPAGRVWSFRDVTERHRAEEALRQAHRRASTLAQLGRELAEAATPRAAALAILEAAQHLLGWDCAWLHFWNEEKQVFEDPVNFDLVEGERREIPSETVYPRAPSPLMIRVMQEGAQMLLRENEDEKTEGLLPFGTGRRSLSLMFVSIRRCERPLGIVSIQSYRRRAYDQAGLELLQTLADHCAGALLRLQSAAALRASEERFRLASQAVFDVIWDQDVLAGTIWWNEHFQPLFGHRPEETGADCWRDCLHPDDRARVVAGVRAALTGNGTSWSDTYRFRRKNGSYAFVEDRAHIIRDAAGRPTRLIGAMRDVTERKATEFALRDNEARFRALVESVSQGYYVTNHRSLFTYCNPAVLAVVGRTPRELLGTSVFRLVAAEDRPRVIAAFRQWAQDGSTETAIDFRLTTASGKMLWVEQTTNLVRNPAGRLVESRCIVRDVTERKSAEKVMRESEALFRGIFEASPIPILLSTAPEGRLTDANAMALRLFGYSREEVLGRTTGELGLWAKPGQREEFFRRIAAEKTVPVYEAVMRTKAGEERVMLCTGTLLMLAGSARVLASAVDITAVRKIEAEQAAMQERALVAQKHEALGTLAGGIAHDFNNILTGVLNYTQLAQSDCPPTHPQIKEFLGEVLKCGHRAKEMVRQILLFSRAESAERRPLMLQHTVQEALALLRSTIPATVAIKADLGQPVTVVHANATQIHQIVMNLGINAAHAMQEQGGTLTVRLRQQLVDGALASELPDLKPGRHLCLEVSDTGAGMESAVIARIFEPFFTTKKAGEGTGLGLAVVQSVMRTHQGAVLVRSQPGQGTTFELFFPVPPALPPVAVVVAKDLPHGRGQRILLVDDEPTVGKSMKLLLERLGYKVTTFTNPAHALIRWEAAPDDFAALIVDYQMPAMTGPVLANKLRAARPGLPVFIMSGFAGTHSPEKLRSEGFTDFLHKPVDLHELARALAAALA
ncbi:MAG: PAS domain S-box protein [Opitutae bacterium]|nr:PAS domain S-box protein [Opitutae bacterium]